MRLRIDGITAMSRGISGGKQNEKKKWPIRIKTAEFVYSLKTKRVRTSTAAGPMQSAGHSSQLTSAG